MNETTKTDMRVPGVALLQKQRSHLLFVLSNPKSGRQAAFSDWCRDACRKAALNIPKVLSARHYEQHAVDISQGRYSRPHFHYLGLYEISVDGAEAADDLIGQFTSMYAQHVEARSLATWLYYPVSEKIGRVPSVEPSMLTVAFANSVPGRESDFREWYATRHIRHALNIDALVSGQCFERTIFQRPGAQEPIYTIIALYEQEGSPEAIIESFASLPKGTLDFPALDLDSARFAESVYRPL